MDATSEEQTLSDLIEKAADFHGHLGPFLVLGVRMGLAGLHQLGVRSGEPFNVEAELPLQVPYSCIIDGLQISTKCTMGNRKLTTKNSQRVEVNFRKEDRKVIFTLNHQVLMRLRSRITERHATDLELQETAWKLASIPIDELLRTRASS